MAYYREGRYRARVINQYFGESEGKGTPFFALTVKVISYFDPQMGDYVPPGESYDRDVKLYITNDTMDYVIPKLRSIGFEGSSFRDLDPDNQNHISFVGLESDFVCKMEPGKDNTKLYEKWGFPAVKTAATVENKAGVSKRLDALFGRSLKGSATQQKPASAAPVNRPEPQAAARGNGRDNYEGSEDVSF